MYEAYTHYIFRILHKILYVTLQDFCWVIWTNVYSPQIWHQWQIRHTVLTSLVGWTDEFIEVIDGSGGNLGSSITQGPTLASVSVNTDGRCSPGAHCTACTPLPLESLLSPAVIYCFHNSEGGFCVSCNVPAFLNLLNFFSFLNFLSLQEGIVTQHIYQCVHMFCVWLGSWILPSRHDFNTFWQYVKN